MKSHNLFNPRPLPTQTRVERAPAPDLVIRFVFVLPESRLLASVWDVCFCFFLTGRGSDPGPTLTAVSCEGAGAPTGEKQASVAVTLQHPRYF